jgi:hypothetical protein
MRLRSLLSQLDMPYSTELSAGKAAFSPPIIMAVMVARFRGTAQAFKTA